MNLGKLTILIILFQSQHCLALEMLCAGNFSTPAEAFKISFGEKPMEVEAMVDDYRLYLVHDEADEFRTDLINAGNFPIKVGRYLIEYTYSFDPQHVGPQEFAVVRAEDGVQFAIIHDLIRSSANPIAVLDRVADLVRHKKGLKRNDSFFDQATRRGGQFRLVRTFGFNQESSTSQGQIVKRLAVSSLTSGFMAYRYFTVREKITDKLVVQIYDTEMGHDIPPELPKRIAASGGNWNPNALRAYQNWIRQFGEPSPEEIAHNHPDVEKARKAEAKLFQEGRAAQVKMLDEIFDFVGPLYKNKRKWSDEFVSGLYHKSLASLDNTRYILVRRRTPGGQAGPIVAMIGLTRAPYGKVTQFNTATGQWESFFRPALSAFASNFGYSIPFFHRNPFFKAMGLGTGQDIPRLGMEDYFGKDFWLQRPSVLETVLMPTGEGLPGIGGGRASTHGL